MHLHLVFGTKNRAPFIAEHVRAPLHAYLAVVLKRLGCVPELINSVEDHVHLLFDLGRRASIATVVEDLKKSSSKWLKTTDPKLELFSWQSGYAAFSVSESNVPTVREYIANQAAHHQQRTFQDELRLILERHGVAYDERFLWD